jgi:hypothetical protein
MQFANPPKEHTGLKLKRWIHTQRFKAGNAIAKWAKNVLLDKRRPGLLRGVRRARFTVDAPHGPRAEKAWESSDGRIK